MLLIILPHTGGRIGCDGGSESSKGDKVLPDEPVALDMRFFLKLLGISYRDHISNEEVKTRIANAIGPTDL